jgi:hypothetical protein
MDIKNLVRDVDKVRACIKSMEDNSLVAKKECRIYTPVRFTECGLASIGAETYIVAIYAMVVDGMFYSTNIANAMIRIEPTSTNKVMIEEEEYYEFIFEAGAVISPSLLLARVDTLTFRIYDEILSKSKVPWYMDYSDLGKIFDTAKQHANANIGENNEVTELIVSTIARDKDNRHKYYRNTVKTEADLLKKEPVFTPLRSVTYAATNTTNRLGGSYFGTGVISALNTPAERTESIEALLRK